MTAAKSKPRSTRAPARRQVVGHKGGEKQQKKPIVASNDVGSIATAQLVYIWSWGPIVGPVNGLHSVKLAGTPLIAEDGTINYPGVKWQFRSGELHQERLTGITEASNEIQVGQELRTQAPYLRSINNAMLDAVRVRLSWPQLTHQDSNGNISGVRIEYAIDVATDGGPYQTLVASEVNRKNITKYERDHRIELPAGSRWTVRVRRITPEAGSEFVQDSMYVEAIAEIVDSDQEYPLTAVSSIEYDARQFGGDIAKIAVLMRGRIVKVPANYDPVTRTYATGGTGTSGGIWDGTFKEAYTNNPAWVLYDLVLHPYYGLGERINASMINRWSLYRIAQYCDQLVPDGQGGEEPRFTCNLYLQKQADAWAVIQDLASIFHGLAFWDGSQIVVNADMPQDSMYTYTLSQIIGGNAVSYQGSKARDRHSQAIVSFDDPAQGFETDKEPVFDDDAIAEYGVRELSVEVPGCTSRGQAQRAGNWALMTEQLQTRGTSIRVGLDGYIPKPGKVISLADPMLAGRANGGRIAGVSGRVVTLDRDVEVPTGARLLVNLPSGKAEARQVRSVAGRKITVMADYSEVPQAECGWALDYDDLRLMQFYVRNVTRPEWHQFQLELIQYEPSKFSAIDYGTMIDDRPISALPPGVQAAPARVLITSNSSIDQGIAVTTMTIGWDAAPGAVAYEVEWRWGSREWVRVPATGELAVDVRGVYAGQYMARVRAVSALDVASIPTNSMLTEVAGKTTPPPAVSFLKATPLVYGTALAWGFPAGAEDTQRTEIWQSATTSRDDATKLGDFAYPQAEHEIHGLAAGVSFFYWARLIDRSGNVGPWFPDGVGINGQSSSDQSEYDEYFKDKITNGSLYPALREEIALISGPPSLPGSVNSRLKDLDDQVTKAQSDLQEQIDAIADLADSLPYDPAKAYEVGQAVLGADGKLYQAKQAVPVETPPPCAAYWTDIGQAVQTATGLAARVTTVETKVTEQDGKLIAQAERIDGVQSSLTITNQNVTAAQRAADAANTLAGGKGKVIIQSATPATADRLAQNLWIDTTNNANTPKRWTGSAWMAVTDKAATDAAAAAASATALAKTKADASVVDTLSSKVTQQGDSITSQGQALTGLQNNLTITNQNVTAAQQAAQDAATAAGAKGKVIVQSAAPAVADRLAQNLWIDTTGNANTPKRWTGSAWMAVTDKVATDAATAAASALSQVATKAESTAVQALTNSVSQQGSTITAQGSELISIKAGLSTVAGDNLLLDPTFADGTGMASRAGALVVARTEANVPAGAPSARVVRESVPTTTANNYWGFLPAANVRAPETTTSTNIAVAAGEIYDLELYSFTSVARQMGLWIQFYDPANSSIGHTWAAAGGDGVRLTTTAGVWIKLTGTATVPAGCIRMAVTLRVSGGDATELFISSPAVRKREGLANAQATATMALDGRITQTEKSITSQSSQLTQLANSLAGKADNTALQDLQSNVTQQGNTLTAQGQAVTKLQSTVGGIGGSGTNLLADDYSWLNSTSLPAMVMGSSLARVGVPVSASDSGFGILCTFPSTAVGQFMMLSPSNNLAGWNVRIEPGVYLVSMYIQGSAEGAAMVSLYSGTHRQSGNIPYSTERSRITFPITVADSAKVGITIYPNRTGLAAGQSVTIDSVMIEKRVGESNVPSPFVAGPSARAVSGQATAISQLNTTVNQQGSAITAQAERVDGLYVQINPELSGSEDGFAGSAQKFVGVWSEQSARIEGDVAQAQRTDQVEAQQGQTSAVVQQVSTAVATLDGKVNAQVTIKAQTVANGRKVMAGLSVGADGETSEILAFAQRFAIIDEAGGKLILPFTAQGGQVFMNSAIIRQADIINLIITGELKSTNYIAGQQGIRINFVTSEFEINGVRPGEGRMNITNQLVSVYDTNRLRLRLGIWG